MTGQVTSIGAITSFPPPSTWLTLACGTGTLLIAVCRRSGAASHERRRSGTPPSFTRLWWSRPCMATTCNFPPCTFAATSLAMLNPHIEFDRMNLYVMPLGAEGSRVSLGSLDFLGRGRGAGAVRAVLRRHGRGHQGSGKGVRRRLSGRGGGSDRHTARLGPGNYEPALHKRSVMGATCCSEVCQPQSVGGFKTSCPAASSLGKRRPPPALAPRSLLPPLPGCVPGEGRLALVLPATVCTGPSWAQTRSLIERDFDLDVVITSHDPTALELLRQHRPIRSVAYRHATSR